MSSRLLYLQRVPQEEVITCSLDTHQLSPARLGGREHLAVDEAGPVRRAVPPRDLGGHGEEELVQASLGDHVGHEPWSCVAEHEFSMLEPLDRREHCCGA